MADRDNSQDSKEAGVESTNENAGHAVGALGNHGEEEEQESGNDPQQVAEEEESKS